MLEKRKKRKIKGGKCVRVVGNYKSRLSVFLSEDTETGRRRRRERRGAWTPRGEKGRVERERKGTKGNGRKEGRKGCW
jgi:hypothetical protein